jgi:hypothetical protein
MKLIKLDRRHNLYHKGYRYAFRLDRWTTDSNKIERAVKELEGFRWDMTFWGKPGCKSNGYTSRPYYIGVRNESTATMVLLKL